MRVGERVRHWLGLHQHVWRKTGMFSFVGRGWVYRCDHCGKERVR